MNFVVFFSLNAFIFFKQGLPKQSSGNDCGIFMLMVSEQVSSRGIILVFLDLLAWLLNDWRTDHLFILLLYFLRKGLVILAFLLPAPFRSCNERNVTKLWHYEILFPWCRMNKNEMNICCNSVPLLSLCLLFSVLNLHAHKINYTNTTLLYLQYTWYVVMEVPFDFTVVSI